MVSCVREIGLLEETLVNSINLTELCYELDVAIEDRTNQLNSIVQDMTLENVSPDLPTKESEILRIKQGIEDCLRPIRAVLPDMNQLVQKLEVLEAEKERLEAEVTMVEKIHVLNQAVEDIKYNIHNKDYDMIKADVATILSVVESLQQHAQTIGKNPGFISILERKESIFKDLRTQLLEDILSSDDEEDAAFCRKLCEILTSIDPPSKGIILHEKFKNILNQYNIQFQMRSTSASKEDRKAEALKDIETFHMRNYWLQNLVIPVHKFPSSWASTQFFLQQFSSLTRNHLLDILYHDIDHQALYALLNKVQILEKTMDSIAAAASEEKVCHTFNGTLIKLFDAFLQPWFKYFDGSLSQVLKTALNSKDSVIALKLNSPYPKCIFQSAQHLNSQILQILNDCAKYSINQMTRDAQTLIQKYLGSWLSQGAKLLTKTNPVPPKLPQITDCPIIDWKFEPTPIPCKVKSDNVVVTSEDFVDLICLYTSLDFLWLNLKISLETNSFDDCIEQLWSLRYAAYMALLKHFVHTTIVPHLPQCYSTTETSNFSEFLSQWQQWTKEIADHASPVLECALKDATVL